MLYGYKELMGSEEYGVVNRQVNHSLDNMSGLKDETPCDVLKRD